MSDIVAFLTAQLDEDEQIARAATGRDPEWWDTGPGYPEAPEVRVENDRGDVVAAETGELAAIHIARHDPARVLAEVAAKRAILIRYAAAQLDLVEKRDAAAREALLARSGHTITQQRYAAAMRHAEAFEVVLQHMAAPYADAEGYDPDWRLT